VSGASDGIVSAASLVVGVAAAASSRQEVLIAGVAGLVAGALSMAGEYVSVSSQADTEQADLKRERHELATEPQAEEDELTGKTRPSRRRRIPAATRQRYGANDIVEAVGYP
jgi:VIT1/CCC1 family predicted Fe2+/Mn2+ transporter